MDGGGGALSGAVLGEDETRSCFSFLIFGDLVENLPVFLAALLVTHFLTYVRLERKTPTAIIFIQRAVGVVPCLLTFSWGL